MYFAVETVRPELPSQIALAWAELQGANSQLPLYLYALADCAFDEHLLFRRPHSQLPRHSLYDDTSLQGLDRAAPHLVELPTEPECLLECLDKLFAATAGKPMLSIIASALDAEAHCLHWRPYLIGRSEDHLEWPIRWADTRVLPALMETLEAPLLDQLMQPVHSWWSVRRDGTLVEWKGAAVPTPTAPDFDKLPISDATFVSLVDRAEADAILAKIDDRQPDLLTGRSPVECHARVEQGLSVADQYAITSAGERHHLSVLGLCLAPDFARHPAMAAVLEKTRAGADYRAQIAALPAEFWQEAA